MLPPGTIHLTMREVQAEPPTSGPGDASREPSHEEAFLADLGARIREIRRRRGVSITELAERTGISASFLSQLERGLKACSLMTLHRISVALNVAIGGFFHGDDQDGPQGRNAIVRRHQRRPLTLPGIRQRLYVLSPNEEFAFEALLNVLPPGVATSEHPTSHNGEEWFYVLQGQLELILGDERYLMEAGDAAGFASSIPHRVRNVGPVDAEIIWVNCPPQF